jgi:hypothetical protein
VNVLIIPEDFRKDQLILKPIIARMFAEIGKPQAKVEMCGEILGGIDQATNWERLADIVKMYPMVDIFLLVVDRDGVATRKKALDGLEARAKALVKADRVLLAENAWQEIEVWALAGQDLPKKWKWQAIRREVHPKEAYFDPWATQRGLLDEPGQGRTTMGREAAASYKRVLALCKDDVGALQKRLAK